MTLKLFQFESCSYCEKVREKLKQLKLNYLIVEVDRNNKPIEVTSTGGTVPVLKNGKEIISDSSRIIKYLEDNYKNNKKLK